MYLRFKIKENKIFNGIYLYLVIFYLLIPILRKWSRLRGKVIADTVKEPLSCTSGDPGVTGFKEPSTFNRWISFSAACLLWAIIENIYFMIFS